MLLSGLALLIGAALVALTAELTARGKLGVNGGAGIRIPSLMASETAWSSGHRAARWWMHLSALSLAVPGVVSILRPDLADLTVLIGLIAALGFLTTGTVRARRAALRAEGS